ncbi:MAG: hypothetical protein ACOC44_11520 [Promethearchaeia archaeon]
MSDRIRELRFENKKLKKRIKELEEKVLSLVGMLSIENSKASKNKGKITDEIIRIMNETDDQLNIVSPKVDRFYTTEILRIAEKDIPILLITKDRRLYQEEYQEYYDQLKNVENITLVNNPNVRFLLVFNSQEAVYSGGALDKKDLEKSTLIVTYVKEKSKISKIAEIFTLMLPSFMR